MKPTTVTHRSIVSLSLPKQVSALITYANGVVTGMTNNPSFQTPLPPLPTVSAAVTDLHNAETVALTRAKGAVATRNEKRAVLVGLLQQVRSYVQSIADANPENAPSIIQSAGLAVKKSPTRAPRLFAAKAGAFSGAVKLVAPAAGHRASYEWGYSIDGGKTWLELPPTLQSRTSLTGLAAGSTAQFRYRAVVKGGVGDWSPALSYLVK